jgi:hypothetical protein
MKLVTLAMERQIQTAYPALLTNSVSMMPTVPRAYVKPLISTQVVGLAKVLI